MASFLDIDQARKILDLGDVATLKEIKRTYRRLARRYHPDRRGRVGQNEEAVKRLNWAYKVLEDYCRDYRKTC